MVAVDLGAQSGRVVVGHFDGERLRVEDIHRFENVPVATRGTLQWDILRLYGDAVTGLRAAGREHEVDSVGVDSWAIDFGLLDRRGRLIQNPVHYRDLRRAGAVDSVLARVPARELYERTGTQLIPINTVFELAAMAAQEDPALEIADCLLLIPDLFHFWLAGSRSTEATNASTTQCYDPRAGTWALDLLTHLGIPTSFLPDVTPAGSSLGVLAPDVAEETGLGDAQVVAGATHDTAAAVAAIPLRSPDAAYISAGTWSLVGVELPAPVIDDHTFAANLTNEGGVAGRTRLLRNVTGLWLLYECRRAWAASFEELLDEARSAAPLRSLIDVDHPQFSVPGDMANRAREFCAATGQAVPTERGAVVRCILESLALKHRRAIDLLRDATGMVPPVVHLVGGGAQNELLAQFTANAAELPVVAGPVEATAIGNLIVQAMALGELGTLEEAREIVARSFDQLTYEPAEAEAWREARERFDRLVPAEAPTAEVRG